MLRSFLFAGVLVAFSAGCATVQQRTARFDHMSCAQLAVALDYESRAERQARRQGGIAGVASIFESGSDEDALSLDSDFSFLEADDHRTSVKAIRSELRRHC